MNPEKRISLITGASSGIGYAIAEYLKQDESNHLVITARRTDRLEELKGTNVDVLSSPKKA